MFLMFIFFLSGSNQGIMVAYSSFHQYLPNLLSLKCFVILCTYNLREIKLFLLQD
jgi:hypothetical protein